MMTLPFLAAVPGFAQNFQVTGGKVSLLREGRDTVVLDTLCMQVSMQKVANMICGNISPEEGSSQLSEDWPKPPLVMNFLIIIIITGCIVWWIVMAIKGKLRQEGRKLLYVFILLICGWLILNLVILVYRNSLSMNQTLAYLGVMLGILSLLTYLYPAVNEDFKKSDNDSSVHK